MSELDPPESELDRFLAEKLPADDAPSPAHREALRERALAEFDRAVAAKTNALSPNPVPWTWRDVMRRPVSRLIAAAVVCLAVAAPWLLIPGESSSAFAFNRIAAALVEAKTARFQMEVNIEGLPAQKSQAYYQAPGKFRQELPMGGVSISDEAAGKTLTLIQAAKSAVVTTSKGRHAGTATKDPFFRLRELLSKKQDAKESEFRSIGEKDIGGKRASGFQSESAAGRFTLWGDADTGLPVRVEALWSETPRTEVVMTDFEINVALEESMFDLVPPADYKVQTFEVDLSPASEADLIESLRLCGRLSGGEFPDSLGPAGIASFIGKHTKERFKTGSEAEMKEVMKEISPIARGFRFALELPESTGAHYAGKGVKQGTAEKPVFWYRPAGSAKFRIIRADLSVGESDVAPQKPVSTSVPLDRGGE